MARQSERRIAGWGVTIVPMGPVVDLTTPKGVLAAIDAYAGRLPRAASGDEPGENLGSYDGTFCASSKCRAVRRMELRAVYNVASLMPDEREKAAERRAKWTAELGEHFGKFTVLWFATKGLALLRAVCLQCRGQLDLVVYSNQQDQVLALGAGGIATPGTPEGVAYYLEQAERSRSQGAYSAAAVMYRSALERLLHEQGYAKGTLAKQIAAVDEDGPEWLRALDVPFMDALRSLGNRAVHAADQDVASLSAVDHRTVADMRAVFPGLLHAIYEEPRLRAEHLKRLQDA